MVSESELVARLRQILLTSDLNTATNGSIRRQLEGEFGVTLNDRKAFINEQIDIFMQTHWSQPQNDAAEQPQEEPPEEDDDDDRNEEKEEENENEEQEDNDQIESEVDEEEQEEEESDEEGCKKKRSSKKDKNVKRKASGFSKSCALSPQLQELVGVPELARTEVVKRIWAYIREKNLQNPNNKKKILCDHTLRGIFRVDTVDMFKMNKLLSKHIWPIETENAAPVKSTSKATQKKQDRQEAAPVKSTSKATQKKQDRQEAPVKSSSNSIQKKQCRDEVVDKPRQKVKRQKVKSSGFLAPLQLSDALVKFFGTGESELSRADVVQRMWKYIKENELQDPRDKRQIICDDKLKELFKLDSFLGFSMTKYLTPHFIKAD